MINKFNAIFSPEAVVFFSELKYCNCVFPRNLNAWFFYFLLTIFQYDCYMGFKNNSILFTTFQMSTFNLIQTYYYIKKKVCYNLKFKKMFFQIENSDFSSFYFVRSIWANNINSNDKYITDNLYNAYNNIWIKFKIIPQSLSINIIFLIITIFFFDDKPYSVFVRSVRN